MGTCRSQYASLEASRSSSASGLERKIQQTKAECDRITKELASARAALSKQSKLSEKLSASVTVLQGERDRLTASQTTLQKEYQSTLTALNVAKEEPRDLLASALLAAQSDPDEAYVSYKSVTPT